MPYKGINPDIVAKDMRPELRRACFESEILLLFADMMADPDFLIHFSIFSLCIARCTLFLVRAWILEIDEQPASGTALMSPQSARAFFDKIELACLNLFWEDRSRILSTYERDMGYALSELQGALYSILIIRARTLELDKVFVSPGMLKTTVLFWVHGHTNVAEDEEAHFSRLYLATRERTMFLLLDTFFQGSQCWAGAPRDDFESTIPPEHKDTLAEILQDIGPGRLLRAMLNTIKYSQFMRYGLQRLRDCLVACQCLYLQTGDASFKEVYLQMPMLQALESSSLVSRSDKRVPVDARDPVEEQQTLEAYCSAWTHMSIIGLACRISSISPSLIDPTSVWRIMLEGVTEALELSMETYPRRDDPEMAECVSYLQYFHNILLHSLSIWTGGIQDCKLGRGGFPKSVVESLVGNEIREASMWYGVIETMRGRFPGGIDIPAVAEVLDGWIMFGKALGFEESIERDRRPLARTCSWRDCVHFTVPASKPLMVCKGCKENRYCSTACQRSDWKQGGHRVKCRRLKT
ncbi:hypothetical protein PENSPDRAFT_690418 [Peniophora sp. CONT]|nr:hypothetical protein PENSPDRAFT_690418 [Peniophora sp. CONT]